MIATNSSLSEQASNFAQELLHTYLVQRNFDKLKLLIHPNISGIGTGIHEVYHGYVSAIGVLEQERLECGDSSFSIIDQRYQSIVLSEDQVLVYCVLKVSEEQHTAMLTDVIMRISIILTHTQDNWQLLHWHWSVPNHAQEQGGFVPQHITQDYNTLLENTLQKQTQLLKEQTTQLEMLANNIQGGMQIREFDSNFTIRYANDGFYQLIGYTSKQVNQLFNNCHTAFVHPEDLDRIHSQINTQLAHNSNYSIEYRLINHDNSIIWVLDQGTLIHKNNKPTRIQCILTDISIQKQQSEELRLSEAKYQIVMKQFDISMFEYNLLTKQLTLFEKDADLYNVPTIIDDGPETLISKGAIMPDTAANYREMYRKIHAGEEFANCYIRSKDTNNIIREYELTMTNIFDTNGTPIRAIGTKKDVSQILMLQREQQFNQTMITHEKFIMEVDITNNTVIAAIPKLIARGLIDICQPYSEVISHIANNFVVAEYRGFFIRCLSPQYLTAKYHAGETRVLFQYKFIGKSSSSQWYEAIANIIKDEINGNLNIRLYILNINERKLKEENAEKEKLLYDSMVAKAILAYEINLTKDMFIKGNHKWRQLYKLDVNNHYTEMIQLFGEIAVHQADRAIFYQSLGRNEIINNFHQGIHEYSFEYRRMSSTGKPMRWSIARLHTYEDPKSGDIKSYVYIEDIHEQKSSELDLIYRAEHDLMTGLYNKELTMQLTKDALNSSKEASIKHALLIVDIDNLKHINDTYGHLIGDEAIINVSEKIQTIFGKQSIAGRIGGDEFCVFLRDILSVDEVHSKASHICSSIAATKRSISIGIAIYPDHGTTYEALFKYADDALYVAKRNGKNQYA